MVETFEEYKDLVRLINEGFADEKNIADVTEYQLKNMIHCEDGEWRWENERLD